MKDFYQILNVPQDADGNAIRTAYRREARKCHPDLYQGSDPEELARRKKRFILITQAYDTLSDPQRRKQYDKRRRPQAKPKSNADSSSSENFSSSYSNNDGFQANHTQEDWNELLRELNDLLQQFNAHSDDLLEILLEWATQLYNRVMAFFGEQAAPDAESQAETSFKSAQPPPRPAPFAEAVERELAKMKAFKNNNPQAFNRLGDPDAQNQKKPKPNSEVERELRELKKRLNK